MMGSRRKSEGDERSIKYYSSSHNILLVGEGDFSFSLCLGMTFGCATNITATSLDTFDVLLKKYKYANSNLVILKILGASVLHGVDATRMATRPELQCRKFHRIIYNFPHAGFHGKEDNPDVMTMHRDLVRGFLQNASRMLHFDGEIHVSHKTGEPFHSWKIEDMASECSLVCFAQDQFNIQDYPGYNNKRGSGHRPDEPFRLGACKTYRFRLCPAAVNNLILLVGEGDFSFSACLAVAFGDATNIIATSFNTKAFLKKHCGKAMSNIAELRSRGGKVMHGIDATDIANHESLKHLKFNRIIFNFPDAGRFHKMSDECQLRLHRTLVSKFLQNAKAMLSERGEIHVSHKTNRFHAELKLESIASSHGLRLIQAVKFKKDQYPGYNTKYGFGGDGNFHCNPSKTFKFGLKTAPL